MSSAPPAAHSSSRPEQLNQILSLIHNYEVMINEVKTLNDNRQTEAASFFFHAIFEINVPHLVNQAEAYKAEGGWPDKELKRIEDAIEGLRSLDTEAKNQPIFPICPFLTLLKLAIERGQILFDLPKVENGWNRLNSFQSYISKLGKDFKSCTGSNYTSFWPGLPACVLAHVFLLDDPLRWHYVISATAARYDGFKPDFGRKWQDSRKDWMNFYKTKSPEGVQSRLNTLLVCSQKFKLWHETRKNQPATIEEFKKDKKYNRFPRSMSPIHIPGLLATWSPNGNYMTACHLDYFRFQSEKPTNAKKKETEMPETNRGIWSANSCAEWSGLVEWCCLAQKWPAAPTA